MCVLRDSGMGNSQSEEIQELRARIERLESIALHLTAGCVHDEIGNCRSCGGEVDMRSLRRVRND